MEGRGGMERKEEDEAEHQLMKGERRQFSVPSVTYQDESGGVVGGGGGMMDSSGFLAASPQQVSNGAGWPPQQQQQQQPSIASQSLGRPPQAYNRSRSASTSSLSTPTGPTPTSGAISKKKTVTACQRCRTRKIRCDEALPACKSCVKAGLECIEVDRSGDNNVPRSHVLDLENRIKWLEDAIRVRAPDVDLNEGPPVELRSSPPAIRIVTTGPDFHPPSSISTTSSPVFALSPASTCATPASFDFSPGLSPAYLAPISPYTFSDGPSPSPSPAPSSPLLSPSPFFQPQDPIAQEVGLLSLSAFHEPKYVGSSSGVSFARLVFQDAQLPDYRHGDYDRGNDANLSASWPGLGPRSATLPNTDECVTLSSTYFSAIASQYPFLHRQTFDACLEAVYHAEKGEGYHLPLGYSLAVARFHVFMVLSIGANVLSERNRVGQSIAADSEGYFASAMQIIGEISVNGSLPGVQSALLLAMRSLHAPDGPNLWYLNAIIMATCVDLGFQRKVISRRGLDQSGIKRRIFWCAYALDRNLGIALGRPLSLSDESFDVDFPEEGDNDEEMHFITPLSVGSSLSSSTENARASFSGSVYLFKIMEVLSSIKTTIYCISQPHTRRWQVDLPEWQMATFHQLNELREQVWLSMTGVPRGSSSNLSTTTTRLNAARMVDLKYHEAVQLLFRTSPAFPKPTPSALQHCFTSAVESIRIQSNLKRYGELQHTWLTAHSIFLSGIMMLHAHRNSRDLQTLTPAETMAEDIRSCSSLLSDLSERWPIAQRCKSRFDSLAASTLALASANSSRMLSPHDNSRRASCSSARSIFTDFQPQPQPQPQQQQSSPQTLEVPVLAPSLSLGTSPEWTTDARMDTSWVGAVDWSEFEITGVESGEGGFDLGSGFDQVMDGMGVWVEQGGADMI